MSTKYWVVVASKEHVQCGIQGGFAQACHGKSSPLQRMQPGDWVIYYSSKVEFGKSEKCQRFTAIGQVRDDPVYQADMGNGFTPFRRNVEFLAGEETPILPLIPQLSFIKAKQKWGAPFRFGLLEIPIEDFRLIAARMLPTNGGVYDQ